MPATRLKGQNILDGDLTDVDIATANKDGLPAVPSMRTLGTGSQQAAAGDDSRFGGLGTFVDSEVPSGTIDGRNAVFTIVSTPVAGSVDVYLNGHRMISGATADYTISGTTITFSLSQTPRPGDDLIVEYRT